MSKLHVWLFGAFRVELDGLPITRFATDKTSILLAYLAMESDRAHPRGHLAGLLWSDQPEANALHSLRQALSSLRKTLNDDNAQTPLLLAGRDAVGINPAVGCWVDARAFQAEIDRAIRGRPTGNEHRARHPNPRRLEQALALYRGHFLDHTEVSGAPLLDEWIVVRREALSRQMNEGLALLIEYYERRGDYAQARRVAQRLVELAPWDETAHAEVMRLLALDGQWSAAQQQYHACRRYLKNELGIEPAPELHELFESIRGSAVNGVPVSLRVPPAAQNLPTPATSFIGRERELGELADLLTDPHCRLVTIVGPGGVGKTRLAIEVAREQIGVFADGVYFVALDAASAMTHVVPAIARAIGFNFSERESPEAQLIHHLRSKALLLVLDGFERVIDGAGLLARILQAAPGVMCLVTSRERTHLQEEWLFALDGLDYDSPAGATSTATCAASAIALFVDRARRLNRAFELAAESRVFVTRICQLVDGLPLGIELAASATWQRSCEAIAGEIAHNLDVLASASPNAPARQRSLRATFDHSFAHLSPEAQDCLARLSVFCGGFTWEAAQAVIGPGVSTLSTLIDKSLVSQAGSQAGPDRYTLHPVVRQYAAEQLAARSGERETALARHAAHFGPWLAGLERRVGRIGQRAWLARLGQDLDNVRQAWSWALEHHDAPMVCAGAEALCRFYQRSNRIQEGADVFEPFRYALDSGSSPAWHVAVGRGLIRLGLLLTRLSRLEQAQAVLADGLRLIDTTPGDGDGDGDACLRPDRVACLNGLANVARKRGAYTDGAGWAEQALAEARQIDDQAGAAAALFLLGQIDMSMGNAGQARQTLAESLAAARLSDDPHLILSALNGLGDVACGAGDYEAARGLFEECLQAGRELGDDFRTAIHLNNLATVYHILGEYRAAQERYRESLALCRQLDDCEGEVMALGNLGEVAIVLGDLGQARMDSHEALRLARQIQNQWMTITCLNNLGEVACLDRDWNAARSYLREALSLAWSSRTMPLVMKALVSIAQYSASQGQEQQAAELLVLVSGHETAERDIQDKARRTQSALGLDAAVKPARPVAEWMPILALLLSSSDLLPAKD